MPAVLKVRLPVGEQGPELLFMQGGEKILTNRETEHIFQRDAHSVQQALLPEPARAMPAAFGGGQDVERIQISVAPVYNINGNALPEELQEVLQQHDANLPELIKETLADWQIERRRRAFIQ